MKKSIIALLFSFALIGVGMCFVASDVKADPIHVVAEHDFAFVDTDAIAIQTVDHVPVFIMENVLIKKLTTDAENKMVTVMLAITVEHRQRMWHERSWGKPLKGHTRIEKYPGINRTGFNNTNHILKC